MNSISIKLKKKQNLERTQLICKQINRLPKLQYSLMGDSTDIQLRNSDNVQHPLEITRFVRSRKT